MSMELFWRGMMASLVTPTDFELSHWMGVLGCGQPISMRVWRRGTISLTYMNRPANSALESEDMTNLMICAIVRTGSLMLGTGKFSYNMMCAPARLQDYMTLR